MTGSPVTTGTPVSRAFSKVDERKKEESICSKPVTYTINLLDQQNLAKWEDSVMNRLGWFAGHDRLVRRTS